MLPRSGLRLRRKTSSCCCPAQSPRTHSLFTCRGQQIGYNSRVRASWTLAQTQYGIKIKQAKQLLSKSDDLDDSEAEEPLVEHDDFVLVAAVVHDVAQRQQ